MSIKWKFKTSMYYTIFMKACLVILSSYCKESCKQQKRRWKLTILDYNQMSNDICTTILWQLLEKNDIYRKIKGENKNKCENEGELSKNYYKIIIQILFLISSFAISIWYTILLSISPKNGNPCNIVVSCSKAWKTPIDI